ncbi:MarR family winged helix-turn-helix transcriptional regulator [Flavobacterium sp. DG1-102-2]|uniref:MarR family winged helix-turn-helix transcriptional regulator n=1 Tax=Flavobacterium sp. DG1-102-2 TaxID=3081663 RepID=UPI002948FD2D|nr:MarR family winged helix-turn-helix transcriptional regulator [Flavobacterium sp. DG1-102-2]MDV6170258.1 MarR family winged helix-turn-helix transcriptional regulator [Flavobacterium sp. DG1-102-2]
MSIFNLNIQNENTGNKIVAGLERLSHVFKTLLWEKAKEFGLSPIQIQILLFTQYHSDEKNTVSYLAKEFNVTKPTVSDAVKVLEQKKLIAKYNDSSDFRSYYLKPTIEGKRIIKETEQFTDPVADIISGVSEIDKEIIWENISNLIAKLNRQGVVTVQRSCNNCIYLTTGGTTYFCNLLKQPLHTKDLRLDCPEFTQAV